MPLNGSIIKKGDDPSSTMTTTASTSPKEEAIRDLFLTYSSVDSKRQFMTKLRLALEFAAKVNDVAVETLACCCASRTAAAPNTSGSRRVRYVAAAVESYRVLCEQELNSKTSKFGRREGVDAPTFRSHLCLARRSYTAFIKTEVSAENPISTKLRLMDMYMSFFRTQVPVCNHASIKEATAGLRWEGCDDVSGDDDDDDDDHEVLDCPPDDDEVDKQTQRTNDISSVSFEEEETCPLCQKTFETDLSRLNDPEYRLPVTCTKCNEYTFCFQCVMRWWEINVREDAVDCMVQCPGCKETGGFDVSEPCINRPFCRTLQRCRENNRAAAAQKRTTPTKVADKRIGPDAPAQEVTRESIPSLLDSSESGSLSTDAGEPNSPAIACSKIDTVQEPQRQTTTTGNADEDEKPESAASSEGPIAPGKQDRSEKPMAPENIESSEPPCFPRKQSSEGPAGSSKRSSENLGHTDAKEPPRKKVKHEIGTLFKTCFNDQYHEGKVMAYDSSAERYMVQYDDGKQVEYGKRYMDKLIAIDATLPDESSIMPVITKPQTLNASVQTDPVNVSSNDDTSSPEVDGSSSKNEGELRLESSCSAIQLSPVLQDANRDQVDPVSESPPQDTAFLMLATTAETLLSSKSDTAGSKNRQGRRRSSQSPTSDTSSTQDEPALPIATDEEGESGPTEVRSRKTTGPVRPRAMDDTENAVGMFVPYRRGSMGSESVGSINSTREAEKAASTLVEGLAAGKQRVVDGARPRHGNGNGISRTSQLSGRLSNLIAVAMEEKKVESNRRLKESGSTEQHTSEVETKLTSEDFGYPTNEELLEAKTPREKEALHSWYRRFRELVEYKAKYKTTRVPQKYKENEQLGIWVNKQRMEFKFLQEGTRSSLTRHKLRVLQEIGFVWAKPKGQASWDARYNELLEYKQLHGHVNVPTKYSANPALGRWVSTQRSQYKQFLQGQKTHMTKERLDLLTGVGFTWHMLERHEDPNNKDGSRQSESDSSPE